jgi:hypothetical protein
MDPNINPLRNLPPAQRFQITAYLGLMWTTLFCAAGSLWMWYGELVFVHILLAAGTLITGWTFKTAGNAARLAQSPATYRDHPNRDGTPRYDDVWGG